MEDSNYYYKGFNLNEEGKLQCKDQIFELNKEYTMCKQVFHACKNLERRKQFLPIFV